MELLEDFVVCMVATGVSLIFFYDFGKASKASCISQFLMELWWMQDGYYMRDLQFEPTIGI